MPERSHAAIDLDTRLAEVDGALRAIQAELIPDGEEPWIAREPLSAREPPPARGPLSAREPLQRTGRHGPLESLLERVGRVQQPPRRRAADTVDRLTQLTEVHVSLLESSRDLLSAYLELLEGARQGEEAPAGSSKATLDVGPFATLGALRAFEAAIATLPGVIDVAVRGYERGDRAIIEIQLQPTS